MKRAVAMIAALAGCRDFDALDHCASATCLVGPQCIAAIHNGWSHTCALETDGSVWCWGNNIVAQLGLSAVGMTSMPMKVPSLSGATVLATGDSFSCAVAGGMVHCWGVNGEGERGDGSVGNPDINPSTVSNLTDATSVAVGYELACAIKQDRTVVCWGANGHGELGNGSQADQHTPVAVPMLADVEQLALGFTHSCALDGSGRVWCWGEGTNGQLGNGANPDHQTSPVPAKIDGVAQLAAGLHHTCAIKRDGTAWCWGLNNVGQLGDGSTMDRNVPFRAGTLGGLAQVSLDGYQTLGPLAHTCARSQSGALWCWGSNMFGELGDSSVKQRESPAKVAIVLDALDISTGAKDSCAIRSDSTVWCWGANDKGQLGTGDYSETHEPAQSTLVCP